MNKSESIANLAQALSKFQGEMTNPKNTAKNPQFNSRYSPLQDILALARPLLSKQGLSIIQSTTGDLENVTISTMLIHESGEYLQTDAFVLRGEQTLKGGGKVLNVQGAGSMITYIRRYQVSAILGIASEDDDDGNNSVGYKENEPKKTQPKPLEQGTPLKKDVETDEFTNAKTCTGCDEIINQAVAEFSLNRYGKYLCRECQKKEGK